MSHHYQQIIEQKQNIKDIIKKKTEVKYYFSILVGTNLICFIT